MGDAIRSADMLVKSVLSDPAQVAELATRPRDVLLQAAASAKQATALVYYGDRWLYRLVVAFLGATSLLVILTSFTRTQIPEGLVAMGSAALGALAGLLVPTPPASPGG